MRLTGWILLLIGGLLCATIAWAALGFLLMGVGLIALQVAERRRLRAEVAGAGAGGAEFTAPLVAAGLQPPTLAQDASQDASQDTASSQQSRRSDKRSGAPYDREAWRRLVESDPDLAGLAKVLADYGPQYVDELATSYLAAPDKNRLGAIVDGIIARARGGQPAQPPAPPEAPRPPPAPRVAPHLVILPIERPGAPPPPPAPANPADALEASLIAAVEEASAAKAATGRAEPPKPAKATETAPATRRSPLFGSAARESRPPSPPPMPASTPADLEASLIAAVTQASAKRAEPAKPPAPPPVAAKSEPDIRAVPPEESANEPPKEPKPKAPSDDLDQALLAALAEISGEKAHGSAKTDAAKDAAAPGDDGLSDMIKKFAPDSSFLRKQ
ncbi:hypothetical protein [Bradyrhizobium sp. CCBAU 51753]|uniref:hypothetical protein n=1 Tax=Bradyrhizobium sp. CCBAU 51753 TaxID=1325100 RepID=UPI001889C727|nr:hypothetical protein [Bradyrhizobium sp. CCBAU 51753]QOZ29147.1 hypothetical protein XH93_40560 [Bradyrhizobium sp. CCBAU 51753]